MVLLCESKTDIFIDVNYLAFLPFFLVSSYLVALTKQPVGARTSNGWRKQGLDKSEGQVNILNF